VGLAPETLEHTVDEEALVDQATQDGPIPADHMVQLLARAKAVDACERSGVTGLVLGGDSLFEVGGQVFGKPHTPERARERWEIQRGETGVLHSGHSLLHCKEGKVIGEAGFATSATVSFAKDLDDEEIDAYIATGEPLSVAGAFTIDARGAGFIESIEGDPYTVIGLSVQALRKLVRELGFSYTDLWA
jgi:Nucleotide-binding protein implicated in inhibition of septum formation